MLSRIEKILENMLGAEHEILPPMSRNEELLIQILENGGSGTTLPYETWTFTLSDDTTVTKKVVITQ